MRADVVWASCFARSEVVEQFSHTWYTSGDLVNCREVEGGPTALLMELFFGECPPFAVRRLELPLEYFSLFFGVRNKASFFLEWGDPYVGWLLVLNVSPKAFVLGGLLRVGIFKGCVQVGPVCSLQLALDFFSELFAQDLQFLCALLTHPPEDMVPPFDETANEEWVRSKAYSPWPLLSLRRSRKDLYSWDELWAVRYDQVQGVVKACRFLN